MKVSADACQQESGVIHAVGGKLDRNGLGRSTGEPSEIFQLPLTDPGSRVGAIRC